MKTKLFLLAVMLLSSLTARAETFAYDLGFDAEEWLASQEEPTNSDFSFLQAGQTPADNLSLNYKGASTVGHANKFLDDMSWAGVPLFVAGIIAKTEKKSFRQDYNNPHANTRLLTNFHSEIDNYTQFLPFAATTIMNLAGYEGRSNRRRYLVSAGTSFALMGIFVNSIKYTAKEMRPDGSTANSWPSGHTATAFVAATIMHKEYGMTVSPWYSVGAYSVATATGVMRVLNNRHWVSDILSGAGLGILSGELGYAFSDLMFKDWGINRFDKNVRTSLIDHPSFFDIQMGVGFGSRKLDFDFEDDYGNHLPMDLKFRTSSVLGVEAAYFFNRYIGLGGRLRVRTTTIGNFNDIAIKDMQEFGQMATEAKQDLEASIDPGTLNDPEMKKLHDDLVNWIENPNFYVLTLESDHLTEFTADLGVYFNYPFSDRWAIGTKALVGRSICDELDINGHSETRQLQYDPTTDMVGLSENSKSYDWDYLTVGANNTMKFGTGISLTYAYKSNFSFKVFMDYDYARKTFTANYTPADKVFLHNAYSPEAIEAMQDPSDPDNISESDFRTYKATMKRNMNLYTVGASFTVSF